MDDHPCIAARFSGIVIPVNINGRKRRRYKIDWAGSFPEQVGIAFKFHSKRFATPPVGHSRVKLQMESSWWIRSESCPDRFHERVLFEESVIGRIRLHDIPAKTGERTDQRRLPVSLPRCRK